MSNDRDENDDLNLENEAGEDERTVMAAIPDSLLAESGRKRPARAGLGQLFGRDPDAVRGSLPDESEGDALLEQLFSDVLDEDQPTKDGPPAAPPAPPRPAAAAPAAPPRPAPPRRAPPPRPAPAAPVHAPTPTPLPSVARDDDDEGDEATRVLGAGSLLGAFTQGLRNAAALGLAPVADAPAAAAPPPSADADEHVFDDPQTVAEPPAMEPVVAMSGAADVDVTAAPQAASEAPAGDEEGLFDAAVMEAPRSQDAPIAEPAVESGWDEPSAPSAPSIEAPAAAEASTPETSAAAASEAAPGTPAAPVTLSGLIDDDDDEAGAPAAAVATPTRSDATAEAEAAPEITADAESIDDEAESIDDDEEEAVATPTPPPAPRRASPRVEAPAPFADERDASAHLVASQQRDGWAARAEWLRAEAATMTDKARRARTLLAVSELLVMAGEDPAAREAAQQARELAPSSPMAHRQARGLLARDGDWAGALVALDAETRVAPTTDAGCHGAWLGAEIARVRMTDDADAKRRTEVALRAQPSDPRAHVQRFCEALADTSQGDDGAAWAKPWGLGDEALTPLGEAFAQVAAHRGAASARRGSPASTAYERVLRARAALDAGAMADAVAQIDGLRGEEGLVGGAGWLAASLGAARRDTRPAAVEALRGVTDGTHGAAARRALAARAIELGDAAAARAATETSDGDAFTAADRVTLAALTGASLGETDAWIDTVMYDADMAPISVAGRAAMREPSSSDGDRGLAGVGSARGRASSDLGRTLARVALDGALSTARRGDLARTLDAFADADPDSPTVRALALEMDAEAGSGGKVARAVSAWRNGGDLESERDGALAGGLIAEVSGEQERAREDLERALRADPSHEGAARAAAAHVDAAGAAKAITTLAEALPPGPRSSVLLVEAALRAASHGDPADAEPLLRRAAEASSALPFAPHLGERAARAREDRDALLEWLRQRREASEDGVEQALDLVREALLLADSEGGAASALLEQALRARPADAALRELYERLATEVPADRAAWRAERVDADPTGPEAARLAVEAALDLERAGDLAGAAVLAQKAEAVGEAWLAPMIAYRCAIAGHGTSELVSKLMPRARASEDPVERLEIYERLAELDELGRKDAGSGLLWRRSILEETPGHLPTLRRVASQLTSAGRDDELEPVAFEIAKALGGAESVAYAILCARLRLKATGWDDTREPVELAYKVEPRTLWTLRQMAAHARAAGLHGRAVEADLELAQRTDRATEIATISMRAAESALLGGDRDTARALLTRACELIPASIAPHLALAALLEQLEEAQGAAEAYESAAAASVVGAEQARSFHRAAVLWADAVEDAERARNALERAAEIDPSYADIFERLQAIYVAEGARSELAELLRRRLDVVTDPAERVEMEVLRGRALAEVGDSAMAKDALQAALDASPDHIEALVAFADICAKDTDWEGAEGAWIRLARLIADPAQQAAIYFRLGEVYDTHLPNPERAELAYQEILKRSPGDVAAREKLVSLYKRAGDPARALTEQTLLIHAAEAPEEKARRTAELASIYEETGDAKKAEATLLAARKSWPRDVALLGALAQLYQRTGQGPSANMLLDRAVADARRALATGRFEAPLFETVAMVAELRGRSDAAAIARSTVAALDGDEAAMSGAGAAAADGKLDDVLAPDAMTPAFRELLRKMGSVLDAVVPFDLGSVRAMPLPPQQAQVGESIRALAAAYRLPSIAVHVTAALGPVCIPASSNPPTIVLGQALVASPRADVRDFLVHRALKVIEQSASSLSRTAPIDLWPLLAAFLKALNPGWTPHGVDPAKMTEFYGRVTRAIPQRIDPQISLLSADVVGTIGNRASMLNAIVNGWGERVGLLAIGDPNAALTGIAWAGGNPNAPPASGKDRVTWIGRNAGARDLIVFSVSDAYAEARAALGV